MHNRAAILETAKGEFVVRDTEIPQPEQGEVLIRVCLRFIPLLRSYICRSWNKSH